MSEYSEETAVAVKTLGNKYHEAQEAIRKNQEKGWDYLWEKGLTSWDRGKVLPALEEALQLLDFISSGKCGKALVPGCGGGHDAIYIASTLCCQTIGLDFSERAVFRANELLLRNHGVPATFRRGDFFKFEPEDKSKFSLVYDYAFFCAIPPKMRKKWGSKMTELIEIGGVLITICAPMDGDRQGGPPYSVDVESYASALGRKWVKIVDKIPERCTFPNNERLVVWKRIEKPEPRCAPFRYTRYMYILDRLLSQISSSLPL